MKIFILIIFFFSTWLCFPVNGQEIQTDLQYFDSIVLVKHFLGYNVITIRSDSSIAAQEISESFPNPFSPSSDYAKKSRDTLSRPEIELIPFFDINFELKKEANVQVSIFDFRGNQIRVIVNNIFPVGKYDT